MTCRRARAPGRGDERVREGQGGCARAPVGFHWPAAPAARRCSGVSRRGALLPSQTEARGTLFMVLGRPQSHTLVLCFVGALACTPLLPAHDTRFAERGAGPTS